MEFHAKQPSTIYSRWIEDEFAYISLKREYGVSNLEEERRIRHSLQLPEFNGRNCYDWIQKMEDIFHFFQLDEIEKMKVVIMSVVGEALAWLEEELQRRTFYEWTELKLLLVLRFGWSPTFSWQEPPSGGRFGDKEYKDEIRLEGNLKPSVVEQKDMVEKEAVETITTNSQVNGDARIELHERKKMMVSVMPVTPELGGFMGGSSGHEGVAVSAKGIDNKLIREGGYAKEHRRNLEGGDAGCHESGGRPDVCAIEGNKSGGTKGGVFAGWRQGDFAGGYTGGGGGGYNRGGGCGGRGEIFKEGSAGSNGCGGGPGGFPRSGGKEGGGKVVGYGSGRGETMETDLVGGLLDDYFWRVGAERSGINGEPNELKQLGGREGGYVEVGGGGSRSAGGGRDGNGKDIGCGSGGGPGSVVNIEPEGGAPGWVAGSRDGNEGQNILEGGRLKDGLTESFVGLQGKPTLDATSKGNLGNDFKHDLSAEVGQMISCDSDFSLGEKGSNDDTLKEVMPKIGLTNTKPNSPHLIKSNFSRAIFHTEFQQPKLSNPHSIDYETLFTNQPDPFSKPNCIPISTIPPHNQVTIKFHPTSCHCQGHFTIAVRQEMSIMHGQKQHCSDRKFCASYFPP